MSRPLIISDCDEVLMYMVAPFKEWLEASQGVDFHLEGHNFAQALRWQKDGTILEPADIWKMLGRFFDTEMDSQKPIPGAVEAINTLAEHADVVVLTNLVDERREKRAEQLAKVGIKVPVYTNQGPKGPPLKTILEEHGASRPALFIDDLAQHHVSVKETAPQVLRLHMCGEPTIAGGITCAHEAGDADARIDVWDDALPWILENIQR
ncbi:MAG: HAD family hydrolase [Erythrobacter sp.]|nr:HAD family hydrolase [Erythrobacter sp.]